MIASAFSYMNLVEALESGIPKLMQAMKEYGLREPEFIDMDVTFRIDLYRGQNEVNVPKTDPVDLNNSENVASAGQCRKIPDTAAKVPDNTIITANGGTYGGNHGGDVPSDLNEAE